MSEELTEQIQPVAPPQRPRVVWLGLVAAGLAVGLAGGWTAGRMSDPVVAKPRRALPMPFFDGGPAKEGGTGRLLPMPSPDDSAPKEERAKSPPARPLPMPG
jgi:hypothetical protein